jgi:sec-independent protein translocase protein TatA
MGSFRLGPVEIVGILLIVLLLFGPGRIGKVAGELGKGIRNFRDGISGKSDEDKTEEATAPQKKP